MAKVQEKLQAQKLRRKGYSVRDIAALLGVSKGSVSAWCREIKLTKSQAHRLKQRQISAGNTGRQKGAEANRQKRLQVIAYETNQAKKRIASLDNRDLLLLGVGLYWGEGVKTRSGPAALVNSDPKLLLLGKRWFEECLGVTTMEFQPYIYISHLHKSRTKEIVAYWSALLELPQEQFHQPIILKHTTKKRYSNHNNYYGVVALRVRKSSRLKYYIQGLISSVAN